jgi:hypothetical protein
VRNPAVVRAYGRYLAGKSVALVGPAPMIEGSRQAGLIESHDVVVRLNHALPVPPHLEPDVGRRTDVLYSNLVQTTPQASTLDELATLVAGRVQWVCAAYPYLNLDRNFADDIDRFVDALGGRVPFYVPSSWRYLGTCARVRTRPNAGVSAIVDLLSFDIARLYVTGFTFYGGGAQDYHAGYRGRGVAGSTHDQERQRAFVVRTLQRDARLTVFPSPRTALPSPPPASSAVSGNGRRA